MCVFEIEMDFLDLIITCAECYVRAVRLGTDICYKINRHTFSVEANVVFRLCMVGLSIK